MRLGRIGAAFLAPTFPGETHRRSPLPSAPRRNHSRDVGVKTHLCQWNVGRAELVECPRHEARPSLPGSVTAVSTGRQVPYEVARPYAADADPLAAAPEVHRRETFLLVPLRAKWVESWP